MKNIEKFLEFNGKRISLLLADGTWWIAIKPICEALNVKYESQFERIQSHKILGQLFRKHGMVAADNRLREMVCLPEMYVYGWLFSVNSDKPELVEYQHKCYKILYNHFHGAMTGRMTALNEKTETELEILDLQEKLDAQLLESEEYKRIQELKKKQKQIKKTLNELDIELVQGQLSLNFS